MENKVKKILTDYYSNYNEDERLNKDKAHKIEFITTTKYIEKYLKNKDKIIIIAEENKNILGLLICKIKIINEHINLKDARILSIDELGVRKNMQKKGIGKLLIDEAKKIGKENLCDRLEFYKKVGFKEQRTIFEMEI